MSDDRPSKLRLAPPLPRPEYVSSPEVYHSALAWSLVPERHRKLLLLPPSTTRNVPPPKVVGIVYKDETPAEKQPRNVALVRTYPSKKRARPWEDALGACGLSSPSGRLGEAVADAMLSVAAEKSLSRPAVPLTRHGALLQNPYGALRKAGPPPMARILETIFVMGGGDGKGVAARWREAMEVRQDESPVLLSIDRAIKSTLILPLFDPVVGQEPDLMEARPALPSDVQVEAGLWADLLGSDTPFAWFRDSWTLLTSPEWSRQLPPRMWVDWASTVIRTAVASAYLWESIWFERLAMAALDAGAAAHPTVEELVAEVNELVPWRRATDSVAIRDVVSPLKRRVHRGAAVRFFVTKSASEGDSPSVAEFFEAARESSDYRQGLREALRSEKKTLVWEAVRYGLSTRDTGEGSADFYGLLQNRGSRYAVVEPGTEWTALMVALACREPGAETTVSALRLQLDRLGLRPQLADLVNLLERAGLARGNADADEAVLIRSPF